MRMRTGTRVLLTIFLIVVICAFAFLLLTMFGVISADALTGVLATALHGGFWYKLGYAVVCIIMIVVAFMLMFFGFGKNHQHESTVQIAQLGAGGIVITTKAIEEMVQREVTAAPGVRSAHSRVTSFGDYVDIAVRLSVAPGTNIPEVTKTLQTQLEQDIQTQTGVAVRDLHLSVTDIADSIPKNGQKAPRVK